MKITATDGRYEQQGTGLTHFWFIHGCSWLLIAILRSIRFDHSVMDIAYLVLAWCNALVALPVVYQHRRFRLVIDAEGIHHSCSRKQNHITWSQIARITCQQKSFWKSGGFILTLTDPMQDELFLSLRKGMEPVLRRYAAALIADDA